MQLGGGADGVGVGGGGGGGGSPQSDMFGMTKRHFTIPSQALRIGLVRSSCPLPFMQLTPQIAVITLTVGGEVSLVPFGNDQKL